MKSERNWASDIMTRRSLFITSSIFTTPSARIRWTIKRKSGGRSKNKSDKTGSDASEGAFTKTQTKRWNTAQLETAGKQQVQRIQMKNTFVWDAAGVDLHAWRSRSFRRNASNPHKPATRNSFKQTKSTSGHELGTEQRFSWRTSSSECENGERGVLLRHGTKKGFRWKNDTRMKDTTTSWRQKLSVAL